MQDDIIKHITESEYCPYVKDRGIPIFKLHGGEDPETGFIVGQTGRNIVKLLFSETNLSSRVVSIRLLKAFLFEFDFEVFDEFRAALQEVLDSAFYHLTSKEFDSEFLLGIHKHVQLEFLINSVLSMLSYAQPKDGLEITIPHRNNGEWVQVKYTVESIQMTPFCMGSPYVAHGLKPVDNLNAQAYLLFRGTSPIPTCAGVHHTFMTDLIPGYSPGQTLYLLGKKTIQDWILKNGSFNKPVIAVGISLGGSLAVLAHIYQPDLVQARAVNPPCWLTNLKKTYSKNRTFLEHSGRGIVSDPIIIITQTGDWVFQYGTWIPENSQVWLLSSEVGQKYNVLDCHRDSFCSHGSKSGLKVQPLDPIEESRKTLRWFVTAMMQILAVPYTIFNIGIMIIKIIFNLVIELFQYTFGWICSAKNKQVQQPILNGFTKCNNHSESTVASSPEQTKKLELS